MPFQASMIIFKSPYRRHPVTVFLCVGHPKINTGLCFRANIKTTTCLVYSTTSLTTKSYTPKTNMTCPLERVHFKRKGSSSNHLGHTLVFRGVKYWVAPFTGVILLATQTSCILFVEQILSKITSNIFCLIKFDPSPKKLGWHFLYDPSGVEINFSVGYIFTMAVAHCPSTCVKVCSTVGVSPLRRTSSSSWWASFGGRKEWQFLNPPTHPPLLVVRVIRV